jgi:hypothetical protein
MIERLRRKRAPEVAKRDPRMYVLVRADLPPGLQAAQAVHAASYLAVKSAIALFQHPTVTVLNVEDEDHLEEEAAKAQPKRGAPEGFMFTEPDLDGANTAFACYDTGEQWSHLPLALKGCKI